MIDRAQKGAMNRKREGDIYMYILLLYSVREAETMR